MEKKSCFFNKYIDTADEVIKFQLSPSIFKVVYTDHLQALLLSKDAILHIYSV